MLLIIFITVAILATITLIYFVDAENGKGALIALGMMIVGIGGWIMAANLPLTTTVTTETYTLKTVPGTDEKVALRIENNILKGLTLNGALETAPEVSLTAIGEENLKNANLNLIETGESTYVETITNYSNGWLNFHNTTKISGKLNVKETDMDELTLSYLTRK